MAIQQIKQIHFPYLETPSSENDSPAMNSSEWKKIDVIVTCFDLALNDMCARSEICIWNNQIHQLQILQPLILLLWILVHVHFVHGCIRRMYE